MDGINGIGSKPGQQLELLSSALYSSSTSRRRTALQDLQHQLQENGKLFHHEVPTNLVLITSI